ncbi:MAG: hypothetical protein IT463_10805 [Planctomycetes bacterium]|nr:hypothetical protein [Planctomycetota bacterium]
MKNWELLVIVYKRCNRFEAEAINAGIVGVGKTALDAMRDFEQMALLLAVTAEENGASLTCEPDQSEKNLFAALSSGTVGGAEMAASGIVGIGKLGIGLERVNANNEARMESAKLDLDLVGGAA